MPFSFINTVKHQMFGPELNRIYCNLSELILVLEISGPGKLGQLDGNRVVPIINWAAVIVLKFEHFYSI